MGTKEQPQGEQLINRNLKALIAVIFLFYSGLSSLHSDLVPHLLFDVGLNQSEARIVLTAVALISILGPLIFAPLADRIADRRKGSYGRFLQIILAILLILGAIAYGLLLLVPSVRRAPSREPSVRFGCDGNGAIVFQERCSEERTCYHWDKEKIGSLVLTNCTYQCKNPTEIENLYNPWLKGSPQPLTETSREKPEDYEYPEEPEPASDRQRREMDDEPGQIQKVLVEPPHLCTTKVNETGHTYVDKCHVYTSDLASLKIDATLHSATNKENDSASAEWCNYPLDGFTCNIPPLQVTYMKAVKSNEDCQPMIECEVSDPYNKPSVLAQSKCYKVEGDLETTYWSYLALRSLADIFPMAIITLLNTAIIIATRETSTGRSEIGRQLAWGAIGWTIFPFVIMVAGIHGDLLIPVIICIVCWVIAALILLFNKSIPLSPPEWWWHTKIGMMAIPLSAIRKYTPEVIALTTVAIILGALWSITGTYSATHIQILKFSLAIVALPAIFILWNVERIVDYCGHANILIVAFAVHIIRFTGFASDEQWLILLMHPLQSITFVLVFVTLMLYMRHLVPRRLIACGQAVPVIAMLCIGNAIGTLLIPIFEGGKTKHLTCFRNLAIISAIVGTVYFLIYHCYLVRRCQPANVAPPSTADLQAHSGPQQNGGASPSANGNNYTPLRIYHNSLARKGHFRY